MLQSAHAFLILPLSRARTARWLCMQCPHDRPTSLTHSQFRWAGGEICLAPPVPERLSTRSRPNDHDGLPPNTRLITTAAAITVTATTPTNNALRRTVSVT